MTDGTRQTTIGAAMLVLAAVVLAGWVTGAPTRPAPRATAHTSAEGVLCAEARGGAAPGRVLQLLNTGTVRETIAEPARRYTRGAGPLADVVDACARAGA